MSAATLLVLSARLRGHVTHILYGHPAPWVGASQGLMLWFRPGRTGTGPCGYAPAGRTKWRASSRVDGDLRARAGLCGSKWPVLRFLPWGRTDWQAAAGTALPERARSSLLAALLTVLAGSGAWAQDAQSEQTPPDTAPLSASVEAERRTRIGGTAPQPCVVVDIAGHRAGHLDCATQVLGEAARIARRDAEAARDVSVAQAGSPDVRVGVASRAGTRLRLRENFGVSIRPPAAPTPVFTNPTGPRR